VRDYGATGRHSCRPVSLTHTQEVPPSSPAGRNAPPAPAACPQYQRRGTRIDSWTPPPRPPRTAGAPAGQRMPRGPSSEPAGRRRSLFYCFSTRAHTSAAGAAATSRLDLAGGERPECAASSSSRNSAAVPVRGRYTSMQGLLARTPTDWPRPRRPAWPGLAHLGKWDGALSGLHAAAVRRPAGQHSAPVWRRDQRQPRRPAQHLRHASKRNEPGRATRLRRGRRQGAVALRPARQGRRQRRTCLPIRPPLGVPGPACWRRLLDAPPQLSPCASHQTFRGRQREAAATRLPAAGWLWWAAAAASLLGSIPGLRVRCSTSSSRGVCTAYGLPASATRGRWLTAVRRAGRSRLSELAAAWLLSRPSTRSVRGWIRCTCACYELRRHGAIESADTPR
jgi:hypothetical protein